jgi:hypothetical protein
MALVLIKPLISLPPTLPWVVSDLLLPPTRSGLKGIRSPSRLLLSDLDPDRLGETRPLFLLPTRTLQLRLDTLLETPSLKLKLIQ